MPKFSKQYFVNRTTGEKKVFSYSICIPKRFVEETNLSDTQVEFEVKNNTIIIKKNIDKQKF